uniref:HD-GYP domain-containing protein n=1 Tax=Agathobacter sp. TaxID=2021311 RepID=UPI0040567944
MQQTILVVDDDGINLRVAMIILKEHFEVLCANSGQAALELLKRRIPDLILLDYRMPQMDGFEVMEKLQNTKEYKDIPVIFLTGDHDRETEIQALQKGAMDFITKPFVAEIMMQRVSRILELSRLQKNLQEEVRIQTKEAQEQKRQVEQLSEEIMKTLANTIDAKDKYTNGHSMRVATYSREIARRCGKSQKEQQDIYYIGLLHDIGKIGIPDHIINKPGRLTDEEYQVIRQHPVIGSDILKTISRIPTIVTGARWHHERYDGKGYPDGLAGEDIPENARLIGVADAYDAMTSNRSYRNVLSQEIVRGEIEKGKGTQFDPHFAEVMLQMIDEDIHYEMRAKDAE